VDSKHSSATNQTNGLALEGYKAHNSATSKQGPVTHAYHWAHSRLSYHITGELTRRWAHCPAPNSATDPTCG
jgi:hypothetical protein